MKSNPLKLANRGLITDTDMATCRRLSRQDLISMLKHENPALRSAAIKTLSTHHPMGIETYHQFCELLFCETKLYTRLALCEALQKGGKEAARVLVNYLGKIGDNQYHILPLQISGKRSYPLPRDLIARTLGHMGPEILPELLSVLQTGQLCAIREVVDAIGFLCFYQPIPEPENIRQALITCLAQYSSDSVLRWKITQALISFPGESNRVTLEDISKNDPEDLIRKEAQRSLRFIQKL
jgi:hypothetical protein